MSQRPKMSLLGIAWVVGMVLYSVARAVAVSQTLGEYGVNPWVFLVLDVGSAIPLALGQVKVVTALRDRNAALVQRWLMILTASFAAPYAYLMLGAKRPLPQVAYWIIGALVVGVGVSTFVKIRSEARKAAALGTNSR